MTHCFRYESIGWRVSKRTVENAPRLAVRPRQARDDSDASDTRQESRGEETGLTLDGRIVFVDEVALDELDGEGGLANT